MISFRACLKDQNVEYLIHYPATEAYLMSSEVYPKDFFTSRTQTKIDPDLCFIIMPFKSEYEDIRETIYEVAQSCGFKPVRVDDISTPGIIHSEIWDHILRATVIIADVTEWNANVFFELGVAATVKDKSRLIPIRNADAQEKYPFDIRPLKYIDYSDKLRGAKKLAAKLGAAMKTVRHEERFFTEIAERMREWEDAEYEYDLLARRSDLARLKKCIATEAELDSNLLAYAFLSAMYHNCNCSFWTEANKDNTAVAEYISLLFLGEYIRPCLRAAYALQFFNKHAQLAALRKIATIADQSSYTLNLLKSIRQQRVSIFVEQESGKAIPANKAQELARSFRQWSHLSKQ